MAALNFELLLRILIAHLLSDFVFQPTSWAKEKDEHGLKSGYFLLHILINIVVLAVFLWNLHLWLIILIVSVGHLIIDAIKIKLQNSGVWIFLADQFLHLLLIVMVWLVYTNQFQLFCNIISESLNNQKLWWLFLGYLLLSLPAAVLIGKLTRKWSEEIEGLEEPGKSKGLENAGKWIGVLERLLIFTFIVLNKLSILGFLLASKSVFRFGDLKNSSQHKKTEYIIIGTFLSFSIAIAVGLIYKFITK